MKKIELFGLRRLRNNDHFQFITDLDVLLLKYTASALGIDSIYGLFKAAFGVEDTAMRIERGSGKSKTIEELDALRDNTWNALNALVKAYELSPVETEVQSALALRRVFNLYGDPRLYSYNEESAAISNLVSDLLMPINEQHMALPNMLNWTNMLNSQNKQFQTLFDERNAEYANRESGDVRAARLKVDPLYEEIVDKINAAIVLNSGNTAALGFASELNEKIKYYRNTLAARSGRGKETEATAQKM